tara:strand:+ start:140 stop:649 length:510 start_codon:yes stop_codon:yes gene_type:complete
MALAFAHLIGAWLVGKVYELISKKKIHHYGWFFLLLGGILPDIDHLLDWTLNLHLHRTFTHSFFFVIVIPLIVYAIFKVVKDKQAKHFSLALAAGILIHISLDFFSFQGIPLFWPNLTYFSPFGLGQAATSYFALDNYHLVKQLKFAVLDMALGTAWIFYLILRKKIRL